MEGRPRQTVETMDNVQRVVRKNGGETEVFWKDGKLIVEIYFEI